MRFCQVLRSKGLVAVVIAWAAAMPACSMPVEDACAGVNCEINPSDPEPVSSSEEALQQGPRIDMSGMRVRSPTDQAVYLIDPNGYKRWIPNLTTYYNLFASEADIFPFPDVIYISEGPALSDGAFLAKASSSEAVYLVSNGQKRWIIDYNTFLFKYHFDESKIQILSPANLAAIPTGPSWY